MALKDWISVGIACAALGVSLTTAYFNVLLEKDDLRVIIGDTPSSEITTAGVEISGSQEFTFINLGNRAALFTVAGAVIFRVGPNQKAACDGGDGFPYPILFDVEPFVLKPGEIIFRKSRLKSERPTDKSGRHVIPKRSYTPKEGDAFTACLLIQFATPDFTQLWAKPAFVFSVGSEKSEPGDRRTKLDLVITKEKDLFERHEPITIFKQANNALWRGTQKTVPVAGFPPRANP